MNAQLPRKRCLRLACAAVMSAVAGAWIPAAVAQPAYVIPDRPPAASAPAPVASSLVPPASGVPPPATPATNLPPNAPPTIGMPPPAAPPPDTAPPISLRGGRFARPETPPQTAPETPPQAPPQLPPVAAPRAPLPASPPAQPAKGLPADAPKLVISGGVFSANPQQRRVIVNGQVVKEGADLGSGLVLQQITSDGVVVDFRGSHYRLMY